MPRTMSSVVRLLVTVAWFASSQACAADAMLFRAEDFVPVANEAGLLTTQQQLTVRLRREDRFTKQVMVVGFNPDAVQSSTISLEMPDRRVYRFHGRAMPGMGTPGYFSWKEASAPRASNAAPAAASSTGNRAAVGTHSNSLELFFDRDRKTVLGKLVVANQSFELVSLGTRYMALQERGLNPSSPPIDAEPPGPRRRPHPNPDWPKGSLTETLRKSLSSTAIGAELSPEHCRHIATCGEVTKIDCNATTDGPEMYFNNVSGQLLMACGGACMRGPGLPNSKLCTACPPPEWLACRR